MKNSFKIIIPLYNVEKWIKTCLRSIKAQSYKDFQCVVIDDLSTDNSVSVIKEEIKSDKRFFLIENKEKKYALRNIYEGIKFLNPKEEDIIVTIDGDDWLANKDVFKTVNDYYNKNDCWLTYGSYVEYPTKKIGKFAKQIPNNVIANNMFREHEWCTSHLRTFKFHLWNKIATEDLLDSEGNFYKMTWDLAFMFPMLEMSREKSSYMNDILYVYNVGNPLNDHKVDNSYQRKLEVEIRKKSKYKKIKRERVTCNILGPGEKNPGLGNQLFCIATTIAYGLKNNKKFSFPDIETNDKIKRYAESIYANLSTIKFNYDKQYQEKGYDFTPIPDFKNNIVLDGYFQSYKYFRQYKGKIKNILDIENLKKQVIKQYGDFKDFVSIHVRRQDYLESSGYHNVLPIEHYKKCISYFDCDEKFLIFSDDIEWCKKNFSFLKNAEYSTCSKDYEDMILMSTCKSNIIANSTFSWWSAWLNDNRNKTVIYPKKWFGLKNKHLSIVDLCPKEWKQI
tara:strand:- start:2245 stop:3762 length:1518 start_codon:yes stop_codon:yes gene_type:complete